MNAPACPRCGFWKPRDVPMHPDCVFAEAAGLPRTFVARAPTTRQQDEMEAAHRRDVAVNHLNDQEYRSYLADPQTVHWGWNHGPDCDACSGFGFELGSAL